MLIKQIEVENDNQRLVTWVECDSSVVEGVSLELKGEDGIWKVIAVYNSIDSSLINRAWKVGGM